MTAFMKRAKRFTSWRVPGRGLCGCRNVERAFWGIRLPMIRGGGRWQVQWQFVYECQCGATWTPLEERTP